MSMFDFITEPINDFIRDPIGEIGNIATAPLRWHGDVLDWAGERTGIRGLEGLGSFLDTTQRNPMFRNLAGGAALTAGTMGLGSWLPAMDAGLGGGGLMEIGAPGAAAKAAAAGGAGGAASSMMDIGSGGYMDAWASGANAGFNPVAGYEMTAPGAGGETIPSFMNNTVDFSTFSPGGPNAYNPGVIDMAKDTATGAWDALPGMAKWAIPTGMATNLATGFMQQGQADKTAEQMGRYLSDTSWDDTKRANTMKGIMGQINEMVTGSKRRAASSGANLGRGGGFYGNKVNQAHEAAREEAAKALAKTYGPSNANPAAYQALAQAEGFNPWMNLTKGIADTAGKWPYLMLMDKIWQ